MKYSHYHPWQTSLLFALPYAGVATALIFNLEFTMESLIYILIGTPLDIATYVGIGYVTLITFGDKVE